MMFNIVEGDLVSMAEDGEFDAIIHGCNCFHIMGGGIAHTIKDAFPEAYKADLTTKKGDYLKMGTYTSAEIFRRNLKKSFTVFNCYTQWNISAGNGPYDPDVLVDYNALANVFKSIARLPTPMKIGFPRIGAGLANGDWGLISDIISEEANTDSGSKHEWTLVEFKPSGRWATVI